MPTPPNAILAAKDDITLAADLEAHGSIRALAQALGVSRSTLGETLSRRGIAAAEDGRRTAAPKLTLDAIHQGMQPPNNCRVKQFLEWLDEESCAAMEAALEYNPRDLPARRLREILKEQGFKDEDVPGVDAITAHRSGTKPCRCKG